MKHIVITISRGYGSGGRYIGKLLAKKLGIKFYDRELISLVADEDDERFPSPDEQVEFALATQEEEDIGFVSDDKLYKSQSEIIREIAERESCVIVGRCADYILRDAEYAVKVFVYSPLKDCMKRVMRLYEMNPDEAKHAVRSKDRSRSAYYEHYTGQAWNVASNYDLSINSGLLGSEKSVELIEAYIKIRFSK